MSRRTERVGEAIRQEISSLILHGLNDPRIGFVTVTHVEVSADLTFAKVFISVLGDETQQKLTLEGLTSAKNRIQSVINDRLEMRHSPQVAFHMDQGVKHSLHISGLLTDLARERDAREGAAPTETPESEHPEDDNPQEEPEDHDG